MSPAHSEVQYPLHTTALASATFFDVYDSKVDCWILEKLVEYVQCTSHKTLMDMPLRITG